MTLASHLHMPLSRCMQEHTERQLLVWLAWLQEQWNRPDRHDHYLMQVALMLSRGGHLGDFKLPFSFDQASTITTVSEEDVKRVSKQQQALWIGAAGGRVERQSRPTPPA